MFNCHAEVQRHFDGRPLAQALGLLAIFTCLDDTLVPPVGATCGGSELSGVRAAHESGLMPSMQHASSHSAVHLLSAWVRCRDGYPVPYGLWLHSIPVEGRCAAC